MKVYVAHSRLMDYQKDLYDVIRSDESLKEHTIILPHEESSSSSNTRDFYRKLDVLIAECSEVATGLGIEIGWAYDDGVPIYCIYKKGSKISGSIQSVTNEIYSYEAKEEMLEIIHEILKKVSKRRVSRQYCASSYVIDFQNRKTLLMYNQKLKKWLQPGGHIEGLETPMEACIREAKEETGIDIKIIGPELVDEVQPVAVERYVNSVGDMIDIQYLSIPLNREISSSENHSVSWMDIDLLMEREDVDSEIKQKVHSLFRQYK